MWNYEKRLQYPVKITQTNPKIAQVIISQFGGPDGELAASMRYLSQRYTMPYKQVTGVLTDIGTEELAPLCYISKFKRPFISFSHFSICIRLILANTQAAHISPPSSLALFDMVY
ncbi:MAG: manganese catalase family protein [Lachnospiraceae bacterium]|nr:manganese catalase family protein [Lachnospiraceae bacterium]